MHSLDIYFWTAADANRFITSLKAVVNEQQLDIVEASTVSAKPQLDVVEAPTVEYRDTMSPVAEKLEQAAIHDSPPPHAPSVVSSRPQLTSYSSSHSQRTPSSVSVSYSPAAQPVVIAPYNPAAPAAPEPIAHREKTPPPPDAASDTGLTAAALHDDGRPHSANAPPLLHHMSYQQAPHQSSLTYQRSSSLYAQVPQFQQTTPHQGTSRHSDAFASYPSHLQPSTLSPQSPGFTAPPYSPGIPSAPPAYGYVTPLQSPGLPQPSSLPPPPSSPPAGGFADYTYSHQPQQSQTQANAYGVHGQVYRPTESEAAHGRVKRVQPVKQGVFEDRMGKLEKGVGRFLKKLDNKM